MRRTQAKYSAPGVEALKRLPVEVAGQLPIVSAGASIFGIAVYARLQARRQASHPKQPEGSGGQLGNDYVSSAAGSHPERRLFGQVVVSLCDAVRGVKNACGAARDAVS
jgi:hypothetical protein